MLNVGLAPTVTSASPAGLLNKTAGYLKWKMMDVLGREKRAQACQYPDSYKSLSCTKLCHYASHNASDYTTACWVDFVHDSLGQTVKLACCKTGNVSRRGHLILLGAWQKEYLLCKYYFTYIM